MNLTKKIEALEETLGRRELTSREKELVKFLILTMCFIDIRKNEKDKIESILFEGGKILNGIKDHEKRIDLVVEVCREILKDKDSEHLEEFWKKFAKDLPLRWKNVS